MRAAPAVAAGIAAAALALSAAAAPTLDIQISTHRVGARPVTMRLSYQGMLRCGRPYAGATIRIPASAKIASKVAPTAVRMNGSVVSSVIVNEHVLTIAAPKRIGITCDSLTMGTVTIVLGAGVRIANPARAGSYRLTLTSGSTTRSGAYTVSQ